MCQAKATLAYGLTVRAISLYFAVNAWPRLEPVLPFFDLIFLRRRKGSLSASVGIGAVTHVPDEVWEEIRGWLVVGEIAASEKALIDELFWRCRDLHCASRSRGLKVTTRKAYCEDMCYSCQDDFNNWTLDKFFYWSKHFLEVVRKLLAVFGLDHPLERPITVNFDAWEYSNWTALIASPSRLRDSCIGREEHSAIVEAGCRGDQGPDEQTVVDISFALPRNIDQRFVRFIRFFNFEVINSSVNRLSGEPSPDKGNEESLGSKKSKKGKFSEVQSKVSNKTKPRWRLWMTCISEW